MPIYQYNCIKCGYMFEKLLEISKRDDPTKDICQNCFLDGVVKRIVGTTIKAIWKCDKSTNS